MAETTPPGGPPSWTTKPQSPRTPNHLRVAAAWRSPNSRHRTVLANHLQNSGTMPRNTGDGHQSPSHHARRPMRSSPLEMRACGEMSTTSGILSASATPAARSSRRGSRCACGPAGQVPTHWSLAGLTFRLALSRLPGSSWAGGCRASLRCDRGARPGGFAPALWEWLGLSAFVRVRAKRARRRAPGECSLASAETRPYK